MGRGRDGPVDVGGDEEAWLRKRAERTQTKEQRENKEREERVKQRTERKATLQVDQRVTVLDLANKEKNGSIGKLLEYVKEKERWKVQFDNGETNNFKIGNLEVTEDEPPAAAGATSGDPAAEGNAPDTSKVYITNLSADTTEQHVMQLFAGIGVLAKNPPRNGKGKTKGYEDEWPFAVKLYKPGTAGGDACVEYLSKDSARDAVKSLNGYKLRESKIGVEYAGVGRDHETVDAEKRRARSRSRDRLRALEEVKRTIRDNQELEGIF